MVLTIALSALFAFSANTYAMGFSASQTKNIVQVASSDPQFSTLVTAIKTAGLVSTLSGKGPFTVFAPTNEAFAKLPKGTLEKLLKNPKELAKILTYHVVSGNIMSKDIKTGPVKSVEGQYLNILVADGSVTVNGAKVTKADIKSSNGVIHVIDKVLLPPSKK